MFFDTFLITVEGRVGLSSHCGTLGVGDRVHSGRPPILNLKVSKNASFSGNYRKLVQQVSPSLADLPFGAAATLIAAEILSLFFLPSGRPSCLSVLPTLPLSSHVASLPWALYNDNDFSFWGVAGRLPL